MDMGTRGPQSRGSPFSHDTGLYSPLEPSYVRVACRAIIHHYSSYRRFPVCDSGTNLQFTGRNKSTVTHRKPSVGRNVTFAMAAHCRSHRPIPETQPVIANLVRLVYDVHRTFFASAIVSVFQKSSGFVSGFLL